MKIYDIIHGTIQIDGITQKIINTEEFQRLRSIKQLGCCNYVFPSATHTRFEHSIGVYHLASKYIEILKNETLFTECQIKCILCAALIHDLGHGPYSHLFDELFDESKNHEYRSIQIFKKMNEKYNLHFTDDEIDIIYRMIDPKKDKIPKDERYIYQIVSNKNGIDVDRFDYIMRDIKMTGLNYGIEYERIMNHSKIIDGEIVYSEKVKTNIEDFFRTRFIMYKEIYNHRTVRSIEFMMKEYIQYLNSIIDISSYITDDRFIKLTDSIVDLGGHWSILTEDPFSIAGKVVYNNFNWSKNKPRKYIFDHQKKMEIIIHNIKTRNIYKSVGEIISDSKIMIDGYDKENIIVDTIKLSYYGSEECKYIQERNSINKSFTIQNNVKFITSIYYKSDQYKKSAEKLFETLKGS